MVTEQQMILIQNLDELPTQVGHGNHPAKAECSLPPSKSALSDQARIIQDHKKL